MITLKLAICFCFLRIMVVKWQRMIVYTTLVISTFFGIGYFFISVFQCGASMDGLSFWQKFLMGKCLRSVYTLAFGYTHAGITIFTDIICITLPITVLSKYHFTTRTTVMVYALLAIG